ncbi:MAG: ASCH domain-containing protein [Gemmatimonadales bacterium]
MRVLSVKQPYASLLLSGEKRFECRTYSVNGAPGLLLLHASKGIAEVAKAETLAAVGGLGPRSEWVRSAIIGVIEVTRVFGPDDHPRLTKKDVVMCGGDVWDHTLWQIGRTWRFRKPIECDGKLNLWTPPPALKRKITLALRMARVPVRLEWIPGYSRS